jgi:hypothetical protein
MSQKIVCKRNYNLQIAITLLLLAFAYIISLVINPRCSWVQPEAFNYKNYIVHNVPLKDIIKGTFNNQAFENSDRITRPLSSMFEIIDTHFRIWLWQYVKPIASLSITFLFSLILSPILFFKFLKNIGIRPAIAIFATTLMLLNPGSLSLIVMLFRPAKAMVNFCFILSLFLASSIVIQDRLSSMNKNNRLLPLLGISIFFGFLFDETAVIIVMAILILFPSVFIMNRKRILGFLVVPAVLAVCYLNIFPHLAVHYGYAKPDLLHYQPLATPNFPSTAIVLKNFYDNSIDITIESLGVFNPFNMHEMWQKYLFLFLIIADSIFIIKLLMTSRNKISTNPAYISKLVSRSLFLILVLYLFHTLILDTVSIRPTVGRVWGPYYYGAYFGIAWGIFIAAVGEVAAQRQTKFSYSFAMLMCLTCAALMTAFPYTNFIYHRYHYYPYYAPLIENSYRGEINRFAVYDPTIFSGKKQLLDTWLASKKGEVLPDMPKEYLWIPIEMNAPHS